jgi:hypothetical protein
MNRSQQISTEEQMSSPAHNRSTDQQINHIIRSASTYQHTNRLTDKQINKPTHQHVVN